MRATTGAIDPAPRADGGHVDYVAILASYLRERGDILAVRVSSAKARGRGKRYNYWGAVRYIVTLTSIGEPTLRAKERASSDRRSTAGAERDANDIALREGRIKVSGLGRPTADEAQCIVASVMPQVDRLAGRT